MGFVDEIGLGHGFEEVGLVDWTNETRLEHVLLCWVDEAGLEHGLVGWADKAGLEHVLVGWVDGVSVQVHFGFRL